MEKSKEDKPFYQKWWFWVIIVILALIGLGYNSQQDGVKTDEGENKTFETIPAPTTSTTEDKKTSISAYTLGEDIEVGDFTLTFGTDYKYDTVQNQFSDDNGKTVIGIPITEVNNSDEAGSFNDFYFTIYSVTGSETSWSIGSLFDDSKIKAGSILPGYSQTSYLYFLYDGPGEYQIHLTNPDDLFGGKIIVKFTVAS